MAAKIFYSWQSDLDPGSTRELIEQALAIAIKRINNVEVEPAARDLDETPDDGEHDSDDDGDSQRAHLDSDTRGVTGSPNVAETIYEKISAAAAFVADVTFVANRPDGKGKVPNPNALIEYGYAVKSFGVKGERRIIPVMNTFYGKPSHKNLPFDMRYLRWPRRYHLAPNAKPDEVETEKNGLADAFFEEISGILKSDEYKASLPKPISPPAFPEAKGYKASRFRELDQPIGVTEPFYGATGGHQHDLRLREEATLWLRVMPALGAGRTWRVAELKKLVEGASLMPVLWGQGANARYFRADDGYGVAVLEDNDPDETFTSACTIVCTTGEIFSIDQCLLKINNQLPFFEHETYRSLCHYVRFLREHMGLTPPLTWIVGIDGIKDRTFASPPPDNKWYAGVSSGICVTAGVTERGQYEGTDLHLSLKPFFEKLYDRCGLSRPGGLDTNIEEFVSPML